MHLCLCPTIDEQLTHLPDDLGRWFDLTHLELTKNRIARLPPNVCQLVSLSCLMLAENELESLDWYAPVCVCVCVCVPACVRMRDGADR